MNDTDAAPRSAHGHILTAAALGAALNPLNSTMVAVALPAISRDFGADPAEVTLLIVTGYLVATLVCQMPSGAVADRIGYRRALAWGRWIFLAGAVAGTLAPALWLVVVGRLLMAAGGALMVPTAMALVRVAIPAVRRPRAFGLLGSVMGTAAVIGPALGVWVSINFGWRWLFSINIPVLLLSWLLQPRDTERSKVSPVRVDARDRFDWMGSALTAAALVLLTMAPRADAPATYVMFAGAAAAATVLFVHERHIRTPVIEIGLFSNSVFSAASGVIATQNFAMYSLLILTPFLFAGPSGSAVGLAIVAMTATMALSSPAGGWLAERLGTRRVVITGGIVGAAGVLALAQLDTAARASDIAIRLLFVGLALGLSTGPSQAAALTTVTADKSGRASAMLSMMRYVGSIAGTLVLGFALQAHADTAWRHSVALWTFAAAFAASSLLAGALPAVMIVPRRQPLQAVVRS